MYSYYSTHVYGLQISVSVNFLVHTETWGIFFNTYIYGTYERTTREPPAEKNVPKNDLHKSGKNQACQKDSVYIIHMSQRKTKDGGTWCREGNVPKTIYAYLNQALSKQMRQAYLRTWYVRTRERQKRWALLPEGGGHVPKTIYMCQAKIKHGVKTAYISSCHRKINTVEPTGGDVLKTIYYINQANIKHANVTSYKALIGEWREGWNL